MKRKIVLLIVIVGSIQILLLAQQQKQTAAQVQAADNFSIRADLSWAQTFAPYPTNYVHALALSSDGNIYLATGSQFDRDAGFSSALIKMTQTGHILWSLELPLVGHIAPTNDGGVLSTSSPSGIFNIERYDRDGSLMWAKRFDQRHALSSLLMLPNGNIVALGLFFYESVSTSRATFILELDGQGNVLSNERISPDIHEFHDIVLRPDGTLMFVNGVDTDGGTLISPSWVATYDPVSNVLSTVEFDRQFQLNSIANMPNGDYVVAGSDQRVSPNQCFASRYSSSGQKLWAYGYDSLASDDNELASSIAVTQDGGVILACDTWFSSDEENYVMRLVKIDGQGNLVWQKSYSATSKGAIDYVLSTPDGSIFTAGWIEQPNGDRDIRIMRLNAHGDLSSCSEEIATIPVTRTDQPYVPHNKAVSLSALPYTVTNYSPTITPLVGGFEQYCSLPPLPNQQYLPNARILDHLLTLPFTESAGSISFMDISSYHHDAICQGTSCPSVVNGALQFDGINDYLTLGNPAILNRWNSGLTMEAWVNPADLNGVRNIIAHGYTQVPDAELYLRINNGQYDVGSWDGTGYDVQAAIPAEDLNNWVHLVGTYDGTHWRLYRNGVEIAAEAADIGPITVYADWAVGARGDGSERFFAGDIDNVSIFARALSANEIAARYQAGR